MFNRFEIGIMSSIVFLLVALLWITQTEQNLAKLWDRAEFGNQTAPALVVVGQNGIDSVNQALQNSVDGSGEVQDLIINDIEVGDGQEIKEGSNVTMHYIGTLQTGQEFANSRQAGAPIQFTYQDGDLMAGLEQGLAGMREGGRRIIVIPPTLTDGEARADAVSGEATLIFAVEVLSVE